MEDILFLIPAFPLVGFVLLMIGGRRLGEPLAGWLATAITQSIRDARHSAQPVPMALLDLRQPHTLG